MFSLQYNFYKLLSSTFYLSFKKIYSEFTVYLINVGVCKGGGERGTERASILLVQNPDAGKR